MSGGILPGPCIGVCDGTPDMTAPHLLDGRLKFRHLLLIDAITRHGTLIGAADELHFTQPAATRTLRELENLLGVALFERHSRGLAPTPFSEAFAIHARAIVAQVRQAEKHVAELRDADRGTVTIGTHLAGSNVLLPRAVAVLKEGHPFLTVILQEGLPQTLLAELESGRLDLVVGRLTRPTDEQFIRLRLHDESVFLIVRDQHPLADRESIDLGDLAGYPWILPSSQVTLRSELEAFFSRNGIELPANRVETTSYLAVRHLLLRTDTIAALPSLIYQELSGVTRLNLPLDPVGHSVGITLSACRTPTPAANKMIRILTEIGDQLAHPALANRSVGT
jgi:DNA-binding transcriptional LysR family regulator